MPETNFYQIRNVEQTDTDDLQQCCWPMADRDAVAEMLSRISLLVSQDRALAFTATVYDEQTARPAAIAFVQVTRWPRTAEISDLFVAPGYRGQGIGAALIHTTIDHARLWNVPTIEIGCDAENMRALALYRRLGFHDDRTLDFALKDGTQTVIYLALPIA